MKLGSLFDGIGGFPLAARQAGITVAWGSEIEPFPIKVTKKHFSEMKHLGDITKIKGDQIEPVDIITAGSPCQDLSVAGKRAGMAGERSGLFMEFVRITREMREATNGRYPEFIIWENVPGAFSSNSGEDFKAVIEEITRNNIPDPGSNKWATAGMVRGHTGSLAWRTLDARNFGLPQRRKRIFLVADFRGQRAPEILFKRTGAGGDQPEIDSERDRDTDGSPGNQVGSWWDGGQISQTLDHVLYKKQALPEKRRFPAVLVPAWEKCELCEDYRCNIHHGQHAHDCDCPGIEEWIPDSPYEPLILRYITPTEGERLMGFPDGWTDIEGGSDTARYKALGNSVAVPCVEWVMRAIRREADTK